MTLARRAKDSIFKLKLVDFLVKFFTVLIIPLVLFVGEKNREIEIFERGEAKFIGSVEETFGILFTSLTNSNNFTNIGIIQKLID